MFIERDNKGVLVGLYLDISPGIAEEELPDNDPEIMAFLHPPLGENDYRLAIVAMMDAKVQERRYDSALSLSTYVGSTNPAWAAEASAFVEWRDAVWAYCYEQLALVASQGRSQPAIKEFLAELPALEWPA